jgi:hypothetical protein
MDVVYGSSSEDQLSSNVADRTLGPSVWGRKAARLPDRGTLLVATDLQGNRRDYERLKQLYWDEEARGNEPVLALCGDLVHGPSPDLNADGAWPEYLGTPYVDESAALIRDFEQLTRYARAFSLLGNHEHAHVGGPVVAKFYCDEAKVLDEALGADRGRIHAFFESFPLVASGSCGIVLTHGAPKATEQTIEDFERLRYRGPDSTTFGVLTASTVGKLLWARSATADEAKALLRVTTGDGEGAVIYGHDIAAAGYDVAGSEQMCISSSFGVFDRCKTYLRIDLAKRYRSVHDLRPGHEILPLYPH